MQIVRACAAPGRRTRYSSTCRQTGYHAGMSENTILIAPGVALPQDELRYETSRSSGPGGQNVNKVSTRVTVLFDVDSSPSLSSHQRSLLRERLAGRISKEGVLRVSSQRHRTQTANREAAVARFAELVREALTEEPPRKETRMPEGLKQRRLLEKRRRSRLKRERSPEAAWDQEE